MTDTPTWVTDAARDIDSQYTAWDLDEIGTTPEHRLAVVTAIILKHCPDDKGKLVDVIVEMCDYIRITHRNCGNTDHVFNLIYGLSNIVRAALAEYEELNK